jgi:hypothetical protein
VELSLVPAVYFLDGAFHLSRYARSDVFELDYKCTPHDESRIRGSRR